MLLYTCVVYKYVFEIERSILLITRMQHYVISY